MRKYFDDNVSYNSLLKNISAEYRPLSNMWSRTDYISVYSGTACWKLQVKQHQTADRTTINSGWDQFADDLSLAVGDICVFEGPLNSFHLFSVRIIKADTVL